jgi:hypothetical protein
VGEFWVAKVNQFQRIKVLSNKSLDSNEGTKLITITEPNNEYQLNQTHQINNLKFKVRPNNEVNTQQQVTSTKPTTELLKIM